MNSNCFRLNEPDVNAEDFKSEILAVNLKNGYYHSLREAAVPIWRLLMDGQKAETIVQWLAPVYGIDQAALAADVDFFISELEKGELIVPLPASDGKTSATSPDWLSELSTAYAKPVLETYTEMQDLLLLDPIHDVDGARGWPNLPEPSVDSSQG